MKPILAFLLISLLSISLNQAAIYEIKELIVKKIGDDAHLAWSIAEVSQSSDFVVQRSFNNVDFEAIGLVQANGKRLGHESFAFVDANVVVHDAPILYYRVVEVDAKGINKSSKTIALSQSQQDGILLDFFFKPKKEGFVYVAYLSKQKGDVFMQIVDANGKSVYYSELKTGTGFKVKEVPIYKLALGEYRIQLFDDRHAVEKKMVIE